MILPSYTFVSTANAFVLRGAVPVFVDIRQDTLNLDETLIEAAITPRTRAIVPVHYAGVSCEMDAIMAIARRHGLQVVEDAAQGIMASYKDRPLGAIGDLGAFQLSRDQEHHFRRRRQPAGARRGLAQRAEIIREKGTDRGRFFRGEVDKYTWQDVGSSFLPSEITAAFLWAQLEEAERSPANAWRSGSRYHEMLDAARARRACCAARSCRRIVSTTGTCITCCSRPQIDRQPVLDGFKRSGIGAVFHYVPLHSSPAGMRFGRAHGDLALTTSLSRATGQAADVVGPERSAAAAGLRRADRASDCRREPRKGCSSTARARAWGTAAEGAEWRRGRDRLPVRAAGPLTPPYALGCGGKPRRGSWPDRLTASRGYRSGCVTTAPPEK